MKTRKVSQTLLNVMKRLVSPLTTAACAVAILFAITSVSRAQLLLHYNLDETTGTSAADSGPGGWTGSLNGLDFDNNSVPGVNGTALQFGGANDVIDVGDIGISNTDDLTVMAWLKADDWNSRGIWMGHQFNDVTITGGTINQGGGYMLLRYINANSGASEAAEISIKDPLIVDLPNDTYAHFAFTMDATDAIDTVFVNGNPITPNNTTNGWGVSGSNGFRIGQRLNNSSDRDWDGSIDDFAIYDRKLSQSEIQDIMTNGVPEPTTMTMLLTGLVFGTWGLFHRRSRRRR